MTAYYVVGMSDIEYCNAYPSATMTITDTNENILFLDSIRVPPHPTPSIFLGYKNIHGNELLDTYK